METTPQFFKHGPSPLVRLVFFIQLSLILMVVTLEDVKRVANLARIEISNDEARTTLDQITGIFSLIEQMELVDTSTVIPMSHAQGVEQRLRKDEVTEIDQHKLFQLQAPKTEAKLYLVPKVIE